MTNVRLPKHVFKHFMYNFTRSYTDMVPLLQNYLFTVKQYIQ